MSHYQDVCEQCFAILGGPNSDPMALRNCKSSNCARRNRARRNRANKLPTKRMRQPNERFKLAVQFSEEQSDFLHKLAHKRGVSRARIVREMIQSFIVKQQ